MNAPEQLPRPTVLQRLNQTPIGVNVSQLLTAAGFSLEHRLALGVLLDWVTLHLAADPEWAQAVAQAGDLAETREPEAMQRTLSAPGLEDAETLDEAGRILMRWVMDLMPRGASPA